MPESIELKSRSDLEAEISRAVVHFEKEFMGRGPVETRTYLLGDLIVVRLKGVLTPAEQRLAKSKSPRSGYLLKQVRNELLASGRPLLEALLKDILNVRVQSIHTDISTKTGERVIVFSLQNKLDFKIGNECLEGHPHHNGKITKDQMGRG
jgi:uncharacterized protein YbcI